jgi:hypothetical protein
MRMQNTVTIFTFIHFLHSPSSLLLVPIFEQDLFYFPVLYFLVYILCLKGFHHGISPMNLLYFNQINPFYCSVFPYPSYTPLFNCFQAFCYAISIHKCNVFQCYSLSFSFPVPPPIISSKSPMLQTSYTYVYVHIIYIYDHMCICICTYHLGLYSTYERKHVNFCLSEPGLLCLMLLSSPPSIYLQTA